MRERSNRLIWAWHRPITERPDGTATYHLYLGVVNRYGHRFLSRWNVNHDAVAMCGRVATAGHPHYSWWRPAKAIVCKDCEIIGANGARVPEETGTRKKR
jgi:hypothetical protein